MRDCLISFDCNGRSLTVARAYRGMRFNLARPAQRCCGSKFCATSIKYNPPALYGKHPAKHRNFPGKSGVLLGKETMNPPEEGENDNGRRAHGTSPIPGSRP